MRKWDMERCHTEELKLLIVDDSLTIRAMLEELIERHSRATIVAMASDGEEAIEMVNRHLPDVILLDLKMPGLDGIGFLDAIRDHWHEMHVLVISSATAKNSGDCMNALAHGAEACFDKSRLVSCARELAMLIDELAVEQVSRKAHRGDAVTLGTTLQMTSELTEQLCSPDAPCGLCFSA